MLGGAYGPPVALQSETGIYVAYRPDSDVNFHRHPELAQLSEKWIFGNFPNNAGDLPRFYALILNIKQVLEECVPGDFAELGVFRGNSAAVLAHYARASGRNLLLFDTFAGFDPKDRTGIDASRGTEFTDTSLEMVMRLVGEDNARFIKGRFPQSIPNEVRNNRFSIVHIDCDLYQPAKAALEFFFDRLSPGGLLIIHDYGNPHWEGIKRAVDEFFVTAVERPVLIGDKSGTAIIRKAAATASGVF
jgi:SAM-dependent methyltransferase